MKQTSRNIFSAVDCSVSQISAPINVQIYPDISAQAVFTGAPNGTLKWQASDDLITPTNWTDIPSLTNYTINSIAVSAAGAYLFPELPVAYQFVRMVWTPTSGTGTMTVNVKMIDE